MLSRISPGSLGDVGFFDLFRSFVGNFAGLQTPAFTEPRCFHNFDFFRIGRGLLGVRENLLSRNNR